MTRRLIPDGEEVDRMTGTKYGTRRRMFLRGEPVAEKVVITPGRYGYYEDELQEWVNSRPRVTAENQKQVAPNSTTAGRPMGRKNNKTLAREAAMSAGA